MVRWLAAVLIICTASGGAGDAAPRDNGKWVASWASAQQVPEPRNALADQKLTDATLRQIVHLSLGGPRIRVTLSNRFGTAPLTIGAAHVARSTGPGRAAIEPESDRTLRFAGQRTVVIPAGETAVSDPVSLAIAPTSDIAISLYLPTAPAGQTSHPGSRATSFVADGDKSGAADLSDAERVDHWFQLSEVDVESTPDAATVVAIGDSITDGHGAGLDANARWPDILAERLLADPATRHLAVVNTGIGGNRVLRDGLGPKLIDRFARDTADRMGASYAILLEGVNDLGVLTRDGSVPAKAHDAMVAAILCAYRQVARTAHARGMKLIGGTIMPFAGSGYYHPGAATEADRQTINAFIRGADIFDGVIDFDAVMRDPDHPDRLAPAYDSGDGLHPSEHGYRAMADAVPASLFVDKADERQPDTLQVALTFDDIPAHGPLPAGVTRRDIARDIIAALHAHNAPAFGFMNGSFGAGNPDSPKVIAAWRKAGFPLGNHSFSHWNLADTPLAEYEDDVIRNETPLAAAMAGRDWHWFRYPFLSEGGTPDKRDAFRTFLDKRGYRVAAVTMNFADYAWNAPYARCMDKGDNAAIAKLGKRYLNAARADAERRRAISQTAYGRDIPYVLLMHLGAFDARMLPRLLDMYEAAGFRFVSLAQAERDPAYHAATDPGIAGPSVAIQPRAAKIDTTLPPSLPVPDFQNLCRNSYKGAPAR